MILTGLLEPINYHECEKILKFRHGDALVVSNGDKIKAHIIPSKREDDAFKDDTVVA